MRQVSELGIFQATPSRAESKSDTTTRIAREIINGESAAWTAKTERLRAARLAREAAGTPDIAPPAKQARKKR